MKRWTPILLIILCIAVVLLLLQLKIPHKLIGLYLSPSDKLTKADAIVVVSGDTDRIKHAIDLYKSGYAPTLILSGAQKEGPTSNALAMHLEAYRAGIPDEAMLLEENARNTYENAVFVKSIVLEKGFRKIILVSSPYHQRRVFNTFQNVFQGSGIVFQNSPSNKYSQWKYDSWWRSDLTELLTEDELGKIFWITISGNYY